MTGKKQDKPLLSLPVDAEVLQSAFALTMIEGECADHLGTHLTDPSSTALPLLRRPPDHRER
jgi:hypothetical protein